MLGFGWDGVGFIRQRSFGSWREHYFLKWAGVDLPLACRCGSHAPSQPPCVVKLFKILFLIYPSSLDLIHCSVPSTRDQQAATSGKCFHGQRQRVVVNMLAQYDSQFLQPRLMQKSARALSHTRGLKRLCTLLFGDRPLIFLLQPERKIKILLLSNDLKKKVLSQPSDPLDYPIAATILSLSRFLRTRRVGVGPMFSMHWTTTLH